MSGENKIIAVYSPTGGCGVSTVASHLAYILAEKSETAILDLVLDFGSVSDIFQFAPEPRIDSIPSSMDSFSLEQLSLPKRKKLKIFAAPDSNPKKFDLKKLLSNCRRTFKYTLLDLPHTLIPETLDSLVAADLIVAVGIYHWGPILSMATFLHDLDTKSAGIKPFTGRTKLVINKMDWLPNDVLAECKNNLNFPIEAELPQNKDLLHAHRLANSYSDFSKAMSKLASKIEAQ